MTKCKAMKGDDGRRTLEGKAVEVNPGRRRRDVDQDCPMINRVGGMGRLEPILTTPGVSPLVLVYVGSHVHLDDCRRDCRTR